MNNKAVWLAKHWGLGTGILMTISGLVMASPGYMQSWVISQANNQAPFFQIKYKTVITTRLNEDVPRGYKPISFLPDSHELKGLGTSMMILGTSLLFGCANALKKEYERLETANWMVRQSEFKLADLEYSQGVEVERWAIELDAQQQISNMQQPPKSYYEQEDNQPKLEPDFSRTATGFLAFLQQKAEKLGNTFEVRWCMQQSFGGKKSTKEEIIVWVTELIQIEQVEWVDEEKKSFRLLND